MCPALSELSMRFCTRYPHHTLTASLPILVLHFLSKVSEVLYPVPTPYTDCQPAYTCPDFLSKYLRFCTWYPLHTLTASLPILVLHFLSKVSEVSHPVSIHWLPTYLYLSCTFWAKYLRFHTQYRSTDCQPTYTCPALSVLSSWGFVRSIHLYTNCQPTCTCPALSKYLRFCTKYIHLYTDCQPTCTCPALSKYLRFCTMYIHRYTDCQPTCTCPVLSAWCPAACQRRCPSPGTPTAAPLHSPSPSGCPAIHTLVPSGSTPPTLSWQHERELAKREKQPLSSPMQTRFTLL